MKRLLFVLALIFLIASPAAADSLGIPNTNPNFALENQWGLDNVTVKNISQTEWNNVSVGNLVYPPIYEKNSVVIPFEIWLVFLILGFVFLGTAVSIPVPPIRAITAVVALGFFGYDYILSSLIGWTDLAWNSQALQIIGTNYTTFTIAQPVITIYAPPYLWVFLLFLTISSALVALWGVGGLFRETADERKKQKTARTNANLERLFGGGEEP